MVRFGSFRLKDDVIESSHIKDGEIVNADIAAAAAIAYSKLATDPRICRIKTGTYTGDGETSQGITGVGFQPKYVMVVFHATAGTPFGYGCIKTTDMYSDFCLYLNDGSMRQNKLISLDSDGFTVDDGGGDADPNKDGRDYDYIAFG